ncbi:tetratricopeptide repeat protein [Piscinibacter sp.]|uniref:tetratricopeptide repeat protein n=1 Tax=Piscinibacter sp. TaxID=1903157 RepID=UPI0039E60FFB
MVKHPAVVVLCAWLLTACVQAPTQPPATVRICDDKGCSDRPRDSAGFDPAHDDKPEETRRLAALADIAAKDPRAAFDLGMRFLRGDGVRQDSHQAIRWLRQAGERGELRAQAALGRIYLSGLQEMGSDPAEAERWLSIAAERGDKESARLLPEATQARKSEQARYRVREERRKDVAWYGLYPYYWVWRADRWFLY